MDKIWMIHLFLCYFIISALCESSELLSVVTLFRHGARTPVLLYEKDPYKEIASEIWPEGFGELTNVGKNQQFELGQWFRNRYTDFIPEKYNSKFLRVMSSNIDRCLMSAASNLAGLYPPKGDQIWNKNLLWQPIPIHTMPAEDDALLFLAKPCKKHKRLFQELLASRPYLQYIEENKDLFQYLSYHTGNNVTDTTDVMLIHDDLFIESEYYKLLLPEWSKKVFPGVTNPIVGINFALQAYTPELGRLKSGPLIDYITTFFEDVISNPEDSQKLLMLSGHDNTIVYLLTTLNVFDYTWPEYASSIIFELRRTKNVEFVNVFFKNSTALHRIQLNQCALDCEFDQFKKTIETVRINMTNWEKECSDVNPTNQNLLILPHSRFSYHYWP